MIMRSGQVFPEDKHWEDNGNPGMFHHCPGANVNTSQIRESHRMEIFLSGNMGILVFSHLAISSFQPPALQEDVFVYLPTANPGLNLCHFYNSSFP